jgi:uncharacterized protein (DUF1501 family)
MASTPWPTRRVFIRSGTAALVALGAAPEFLVRAAAAERARRRLLVVIFQRGAADGLNMVVPYGEADYYRLRPSIAVARPGAPEGALDLDGFFGLHPRLAPLLPLWTNRSLAIVQACGSHDVTRSHFDAQDYMETGTPGVKSTRDGWLNRYLQTSGEESPLRGLALTRQMPRVLQGRASALAFPDSRAFALAGDAQARSAFERGYDAASDAKLQSGARDAFAAIRTIQSAISAGYTPAGGALYPSSPLGRALQDVARLVKADIGIEIVFAESTGWDHHVNEGGAAGQLAQRLDDLGRSIAALTADLGDRMADTVIATMSEFGRTAAENGTRGTDHGHGNVMMLAGGGVRGGLVHGRWPGLRDEARFESRDLAVTTDFRDVLTEVVHHHLGIDSASVASIFPGHTATRIGLFGART